MLQIADARLPGLRHHNPGFYRQLAHTAQELRRVQIGQVVIYQQHVEVVQLFKEL
jgi:hypothetical protein